MKGISPLISTVILVAVTLSVASIVANFIANTSQRVADDAASDIAAGIRCKNAAMDFDTEFGSLGIDWSLGPTDKMDVKIINTGEANLYGFSVEAWIDSGTESVKNFNMQEAYKRDRNNPLKPGQSAILKANITEGLSGNLKSLKVLNAACPQAYAERSL